MLQHQHQRRRRRHTPFPKQFYINQNQSLLLSLPSELRNEIYKYVLRRSAPISINHRQPYTLPGADWSHKRLPALLHASRQLRIEALPIYYRANVFKIVCGGTSAHRQSIRRWLDAAGREAVANLRYLMLARNEVAALDAGQPHGPSLYLVERCFSLLIGVRRRSPTTVFHGDCTQCQLLHGFTVAINSGLDCDYSSLDLGPVSETLQLLLHAPGDQCISRYFLGRPCAQHSSREACAVDLLRRVKNLDDCSDCAQTRASIGRMRRAVDRLSAQNRKLDVTAEVVIELCDTVAGLDANWPSKHLRA